MPGIKRLMRETRTILAVPVVEIDGVLQIVYGPATAPLLTPFATPASAALNFWQQVLSPAHAAGGIGGNVSGAVLDGVSLGLGASATDSTLTIISVGNEVSPTLNKVNASFEFMRDLDHVATGMYNLAWQLFRRPDITYGIIDRVQGGKKYTTPFAVGDVIDGYIVNTDNGIDVVADQKPTTFTQNFAPTGVVLPNYSLTA